LNWQRALVALAGRGKTAALQEARPLVALAGRGKTAALKESRPLRWKREDNLL